VPAGGFDAVIVDLPDADNPILGRLYSQEFYTLVTRTLAPNGLVVVQSGSPYSTPAAFWRTVSTIQAAGFAVTPYHVDVPTFGDWGFTLGRRGDIAPIPTVPKDAPPLRFLNQPVLNAATVFSWGRRSPAVAALDVGESAHHERHAQRLPLSQTPSGPLSSSRRKPSSSRIATPSSTALSYFDPGASPATT